MKRVLTVELLTIILILILISLFTYIDSRQFMLEGFTGSNQDTDKKIRKKLICFHAEWCGHCKRMMPEWKKFKQEYPDHCEDYEDKDITDEQREKYGVNGYPTIIVEETDGVVKPYEGERTYAAFKKCLTE